MSSSEINVKFQGIIMKIGKMEYFCEKINSTQGQKRKTQTNLGGVYKGREGERRKEDSFRLCWGQKRFSRNQRIKVAFLTRKKRITESDEQSDSPVRRVGLVQLAERASWIERPVQLARVESGSNGRVGSNVPVDGLSPTRRTGELERANRATRPRCPTRSFGELDLVQLAEHASWIDHIVQLARSTSWTEDTVELACSASWTEHTVQLARSASWTTSSCSGPDLMPFTEPRWINPSLSAITLVFHKSE
ncbi:hypothetical protein YC2023_117297 [Brassica napus]